MDRMAMITVGIDIGSNTATALLDDDTMVAVKIFTAGYNSRMAGDRVLAELLNNAGYGENSIERIVAAVLARAL